MGGLDLKRLRPKVVLHFHLSDTAIRTRSGLVRPEYGTANTLNQLREWLTETGCHGDRATGAGPGGCGPGRRL